MNKTKITYILFNIDKAIAFEWITEKLDSKFELSFIFIGLEKGHLYNWLQKREIETHFISYTSKKNIVSAWFKTYKALRSIKPNTIHTHLFVANIIGLTVGKFVRIPKRIYTRHHSTFHHKYYPKAVKWDKLCNHMATDIIAISENVKNVLIKKEKVNLKKIHLIHHGFNLKEFRKVDEETIFQVKEKYKIQNNSYPVIGVISRYIKLKGIQFIIPAFKEILKTHPNAVLILANANGPDKDYIHSILKKELNINNFIEIHFENNLFALYQIFDIYIHTPIDSEIEAFGQTYVEALAAGIPSIFTLSGVAKEFIKHKENALVVNYRNIIEIHDSIYTLLNDDILKNKLIKNGKISVEEFKLNLFIEKLENIYQ